jgi:large subunit ribosomal protein L10
MGMNRAEKQAEIKQLNDRFANDEIVVVTHYAGLTVAEMTNLRHELRKEGATFKVSKNTLTKLALKGTKFEGITDLMSGPTGLATSKDMLSAARVVYNFAKANNKLVIMGGATSAGVLSMEKIVYLATLPTMDQLRGKIIGILQAPGAQLARLASAYATKDAAAAE